MKKHSKLWAIAALSLPLLLSGCTATSANDQVQGQVTAPAPAPSTFVSEAATTVFIPDVEGLTVKEVKPVLAKLGLEAKWDHAVSDPSGWVITSVDPGIGKEVDKGSIVNLKLITAAAYAKQQAGPAITDNPVPSSSATPTSVPSTSASTEPGTGTLGATNSSGTAVSAPSIASTVYYPNCTAVKAAGKAPLSSSDPGYRAALDRDGDGIACEV